MARAAEDLTVFLNVRMTSRRCPGKMLRPFAGTTLVDLCLEKVGALGWPRTWYGAWEPELLARAEGRPGLTIFRRSRASALADSDPHLVFEILRAIPTRWVMWLNPCAPLVSVATWREALAFFLKGDHASLTAVRELGGWFYDREGRLLNDTGGNVDTVEATPILQVAHAFHVYDRARMLESGRPWPNAPGDPYLYPIPEAEAHDIDTEDEFAVVEYLYRKRQGVEP